MLIQCINSAKEVSGEEIVLERRWLVRKRLVRKELWTTVWVVVKSPSVFSCVYNAIFRSVANYHQADSSNTDLSFCSVVSFSLLSSDSSDFNLFLIPSTNCSCPCPLSCPFLSCFGPSVLSSCSLSTCCVYQSRLKTLSNLASMLGFS